MAQLMPLPLTVSCFSKIQIGFTFLVPAHLAHSSGQRAVKRACVCAGFTCVPNWQTHMQTRLHPEVCNSSPHSMICMRCGYKRLWFELRVLIMFRLWPFCSVILILDLALRFDLWNACLCWILSSWNLFAEEPSKAALKNKKKREAKARRKLEEQQHGDDGGLTEQMHSASLNWVHVIFQLTETRTDLFS